MKDDTMRISRIGAAILVAGSIGLASPALAQMGDHPGSGYGDRHDGDHHDGDHHDGDHHDGDRHGGNWSNHRGGDWNNGRHHGWRHQRHCWWTWHHHHRVRHCR
jgi:hypothetical protein